MAGYPGEKLTEGLDGLRCRNRELPFKSESTLMPNWLVTTSIVCVVMAAICTTWIALDLFAGHKQHLWITNLVRPIIKHGIRMAAMPAFGPTHTDEEIWNLAAFIRHLPDLTAQERDSLRPADSAQAHHHGDETIVPPEKAVQPVQRARAKPLIHALTVGD